MSNIPYAVPAGRWGARMGDGELRDLMVYDGLTCAFDEVHMAVHGNTAAMEYAISRREQDEWALRSHARAPKAADEGKFQDEIVPVNWIGRKGKPNVVDKDEAIRRDTSLDQLAKLAPIYASDGSITAGNAPGVNDGAGAFVLMSEEKAAELGKRPLATILGFSTTGMPAHELAAAPGFAINKLLKKNGLTVQDIDLFEVNEAFASVVLTCEKIVGFDLEKVNVNGGAIAIGHPIGASGARILMTLVYELKRRGGGWALPLFALGQRQGDAVLVQVH